MREEVDGTGKGVSVLAVLARAPFSVRFRSFLFLVLDNPLPGGTKDALLVIGLSLGCFEDESESEEEEESDELLEDEDELLEEAEGDLLRDTGGWVAIA